MVEHRLVLLGRGPALVVPAEAGTYFVEGRDSCLHRNDEYLALPILQVGNWQGNRVLISHNVILTKRSVGRI